MKNVEMYQRWVIKTLAVLLLVSIICVLFIGKRYREVKADNKNLQTLLQETYNSLGGL